MEKKEQMIMVAVDESQESMYALSWCITHLFSDTAANKLVLLYVKPSPAVYPDYIFSSDPVSTMEKYGEDLVTSVMERAEAICRNLHTHNIKMERVVASGDAKDVICGAVQKLKADTLVMGSHGYGFFKRYSPHLSQYNYIFNSEDSIIKKLRPSQFARRSLEV